VAELPEARLLLVGRSPAPEVRALAGPTVEVTGTVADVTPYLQRARVAVAPLRSGGGTRLKILEALGAGRPVVATRIGAEGLDDLAGGGGVTLADEPAAMARAIVELLRDPARAQELGRAGHDSVNARFAWDATLAPLVAAVGG
jgi:glycosyltransferase involved in cell wall biosynthesis